eukprot:3575704-Pyramimonas_sp.AAC.1
MRWGVAGGAGGAVSTRAAIPGRGRGDISSPPEGVRGGAWHFLDDRGSAQGGASLCVPPSRAWQRWHVPATGVGAWGCGLYAVHAPRAWQGWHCLTARG